MREFAIFILAHGHLAEHAKAGAEMIMGRQEHLRAFGLFPGMGYEDLARPVRAALDEMQEKGVKQFVFLADIPFGTPSNLSVRMSLEREDIVAVGGFNMPLLIELCGCDAADAALLNELVAEARLSMVNLTEKAAGMPRATQDEEDL